MVWVMVLRKIVNHILINHTHLVIVNHLIGDSFAYLPFRPVVVLEGNIRLDSLVTKKSFEYNGMYYNKENDGLYYWYDGTTGEKHATNSLEDIVWEEDEYLLHTWKIDSNKQNFSRPSPQLKIGEFVEYDVEYEDIYSYYNYNFTKKDGWRVLDNGRRNSDGSYKNVKLVSTGIPEKLSYEEFKENIMPNNKYKIEKAEEIHNLTLEEMNKSIRFTGETLGRQIEDYSSTYESRGLFGLGYLDLLDEKYGYFNHNNVYYSKWQEFKYYVYKDKQSYEYVGADANNEDYSKNSDECGIRIVVTLNSDVYYDANENIWKIK